MDEKKVIFIGRIRIGTIARTYTQDKIKTELLMNTNTNS